MAHSVSGKNKVMIVIGVLSLVGLLSYTFTHTGNLLASYVNPSIVGFLAAAGIEMSIVGLSMRIGELKKAGLSTRFFWGTLIAVVVVSAFANIAEGYLVKFGKPLVLADIGNLDIVQAVVSFAATGLISLVTLALSELVGQDVIAVQRAQKKAEKPEEDAVPEYTVTHPLFEEIESPKTPELPAPKPSEEKHYGTLSPAEFSAWMETQPDKDTLSIADVMSRLQLSHSTAQRRLAEHRLSKQ